MKPDCCEEVKELAGVSSSAKKRLKERWSLGLRVGGRYSHPSTLQPVGLLGSRCRRRSESCLVYSRNVQEHRV